VNEPLLREVDTVRRLAGIYGRWRGTPGGLVGHDNRVIAETGDVALAVYLARLHNVFPLLVNATLDLRRKLSDREAMTKEMNLETSQLPRRRVSGIRRNTQRP